jgi:hypothetical protein
MHPCLLSIVSLQLPIEAHKAKIDKRRLNVSGSKNVQWVHGNAIAIGTYRDARGDTSEYVLVGCSQAVSSNLYVGTVQSNGHT